MSLLQIIFLGILQGFTEFLPVSSSGHLILFERLFNIDADFLLINLMLHLGSLVAVVIVYYKEVFNVVRHPFSKFSKMLYITTAISVAIAFGMRFFFEDLLNGKLLATGFMLTALVLMFTSFFVKDKGGLIDREMDYKTSILVGISQGFAVLPGVSRSGMTISTGLLNRVKREEITAFSFVCSLPIILGGVIVEFMLTPVIEAISPLYLMVGFVFSFISSFLAIKFITRLIKKDMYFPFVIYLILVGIVSLFV